MKDDNILKEKSLAFGIRIVRLAKYFIKKTSVAEQPIFTQILKSGTSIGANIREAFYAHGKADFIAQYIKNGDLYSMIIEMINTMPCVQCWMIRGIR